MDWDRKHPQLAEFVNACCGWICVIAVWLLLYGLFVVLF